MRAKALLKQIQRLGGYETRQRGSHVRIEAPTPDGHKAHTSVPIHAEKEIPIGTLRKIEQNLEPAFGKGWLTK